MAQYTNDFRNAQTVDDLKIMLNKYFDWFFSNLDSLNVIQLFTEQCNIQSQDGNTVINGTQFVMKDSSGNIRLVIGLDKTTGKFEFEMHNAAGTVSVGIDDNGDGTFTGTITGGKVRTAASGKRVELSGNSLKTYNASEQLEGLVFGDATGGQYGDVYLYSQGLPVAVLYNTITDGYIFKPLNSKILQLGSTGLSMATAGNWDCSNAKFSNLKNASGQTYSTTNYVDAKVTGATGSFTSANGKTVTVSNGLIVSIV